jgi:hypothetical protein
MEQREPTAPSTAATAAAAERLPRGPTAAMAEQAGFPAAAAAAAEELETLSPQGAAERGLTAVSEFGYGRWIVARYAMVEEKTGLVYNVIELDLGSNYELVNGYRYIASNHASPGDYFNGETFTRTETPQTPEPESGRKIEDTLQEALLRIELLEQNQDTVIGDLANLSGRVADAEQLRSDVE